METHAIRYESREGLERGVEEMRAEAGTPSIEREVSLVASQGGYLRHQ